MTLRTLNYGNYGIFLIMGSAGFCPSAVGNRPPTVSCRLVTVNRLENRAKNAACEKTSTSTRPDARSSVALG